jgi:DNA-directed RNA polymerase III subunit RPC11
MKPKETEDVMGGAQAWENVDKTAIRCPLDGCDGGEAYFKTMQIRSADEPSTIFYMVG